MAGCAVSGGVQLLRGLKKMPRRRDPVNCLAVTEKLADLAKRGYIGVISGQNRKMLLPRGCVNMCYALGGKYQPDPIQTTLARIALGGWLRRDRSVWYFCRPPEQNTATLFEAARQIGLATSRDRAVEREPATTLFAL